MKKILLILSILSLFIVSYILYESYKDGEKDGKETLYIDGEIFTETNYKDGEKDGKDITYLPGDIIIIEYYKDGKLIEE